jgi:hypothetical protein
MELIGGEIFLRIDGVDRALGDTNGAVDTQVWIDGKEVRAFNKAIDGADIYAIRVFTANAAFSHNVGHGFSILI